MAQIKPELFKKQPYYLTGGALAQTKNDEYENHPHSGLKWRSPREFIRAKTETA